MMSKGKGPRTFRAVRPAAALPPFVRVICDSKQPARVRAVVVLRAERRGEPYTVGVLTLDAATLDGARERVAAWCAALGFSRDDARESAQGAVAAIRRMGRR